MAICSIAQGIPISAKDEGRLSIMTSYPSNVDGTSGIGVSWRQSPVVSKLLTMFRNITCYIRGCSFISRGCIIVPQFFLGSNTKPRMSSGKPHCCAWLPIVFPLMWEKQCHKNINAINHPWLGMGNIPPIKMVMTGGWLIVLPISMVMNGGSWYSSWWLMMVNDDSFNGGEWLRMVVSLW